ncbi:MAG: hypothetical protein IJU20_00870 [Clostridia bacterium]|nr:hypothetical protein [Clostridia bacterium]
MNLFFGQVGKEKRFSVLRILLLPLRLAGRLAGGAFPKTSAALCRMIRPLRAAAIWIGEKVRLLLHRRRDRRVVNIRLGFGSRKKWIDTSTRIVITKPSQKTIK